jgi:ribokinase
MAVDLTVVGSINLDLVARVEQLPRAGETVTATAFRRQPGGKGANQAVAAARMGAGVRMVGAVGEDGLADEAVAGLVANGVELDLERRGQTGVALIYVDSQGENSIAVFPGANGEVTPRAVEGAVLCQLEVPDAVVLAAARNASFFALNAAPARVLDLEPDLLVVNRLEHETVKRGKLVAVTDGANGAVLFADGKQVAGSAPPPIIPIDTTGAGDAFTAWLTVGLLEGQPYDEALHWAVVAGAYAAATLGAQTSLPARDGLAAWLKTVHG